MDFLILPPKWVPVYRKLPDLAGYILEWAASRQNQQNECVPSEDSSQPWHPPSLISLRCLYEETLGPELPIEYTVKTDQSGRMRRLIEVFAGCTLILFFHVVVQNGLIW